MLLVLHPCLPACGELGTVNGSESSSQPIPPRILHGGKPRARGLQAEASTGSSSDGEPEAAGSGASGKEPPRVPGSGKEPPGSSNAQGSSKTAQQAPGSRGKEPQGAAPPGNVGKAPRISGSHPNPGPSKALPKRTLADEIAALVPEAERSPNGSDGLPSHQEDLYVRARVREHLQRLPCEQASDALRLIAAAAASEGSKGQIFLQAVRQAADLCGFQDLALGGSLMPFQWDEQNLHFLRAELRLRVDISVIAAKHGMQAVEFMDLMVYELVRQAGLLGMCCTLHTAHCLLLAPAHVLTGQCPIRLGKPVDVMADFLRCQSTLLVLDPCTHEFFMHEVGYLYCDLPEEERLPPLIKLMAGLRPQVNQHGPSERWYAGYCEVDSRGDTLLLALRATLGEDPQLPIPLRPTTARRVQTVLPADVVQNAGTAAFALHNNHVRFSAVSLIRGAIDLPEAIDMSSSLQESLQLERRRKNGKPGYIYC